MRCPRLIRRTLGLVLALAAAATGGELVIVHTNDLHGYVFPRRFAGEQLPESMLGKEIGGLFSAASYVRWLRQGRLPRKGRRGEAERPDGVLFLDAGDWFGGTLYGEHTRGRAIAEVMVDPSLGLDATTFGNHAWDYGTPALQDFLGVLRDKVPVVVANVTYQGRPVAPPYRIFEVAGRRVGVIGVLTDGALRAASPSNTKGWKVDAEEAALQRLLPELRSRCDYVVLLSHIGYGRDGRKRAGLDALDQGHPEWNVDLVVDGHSHRDEQLWVDPDTFCAQADHYGLRLGVVRIPLLPGGRFGKPTAERVLLDAGRLRQDSGMVRRHRKAIESRNQIEGAVVVESVEGLKVPHLLRTDPALDSPMGNLVCAAFRRAAAAEGHPADFAVAYHNGVRSGLYAAPGGGITAGALHAVSPFGGEVTVVELPGAMFHAGALAKAYETRSRMSFEGAHLVASEDAGGRRELVSFSVGGAPFDPGRRYRVVMDDFMQGWFRGPEVRRWKLDASPKQALRDLLLSAAADGPLDAAALARLTVPSAELRRE